MYPPLPTLQHFLYHHTAPQSCQALLETLPAVQQYALGQVAKLRTGSVQDQLQTISNLGAWQITCGEWPDLGAQRADWGGVERLRPHGNLCGSDRSWRILGALADFWPRGTVP